VGLLFLPSFCDGGFRPSLVPSSSQTAAVFRAHCDSREMLGDRRITRNSPRGTPRCAARGHIGVSLIPPSAILVYLAIHRLNKTLANCFVGFYPRLHFRPSSMAILSRWHRLHLEKTSVLLVTGFYVETAFRSLPAAMPIICGK